MAEVQWAGQFNALWAERVDPGDTVRINLSYWGYNRGAIRWKTVVIIQTIQTPLLMLDATQEWGESADRPLREWYLRPNVMTESTMAITCYLMAHDDAGYWFEPVHFWQYYYGYSLPPDYNGSAGLRPLAFSILYLEPRGVVPGEPNPPSTAISQVSHVQYTDGNTIEEEIPVPPPRQTSALPWLLMMGGAGMILLTAGGKPKTK